MRLFLSRRERIRREAADWAARLQGPASADDHAAFHLWYGADPAHAAAFDRMRAILSGAALLSRSEAEPAGAAEPELRRALPARGYAVAAGIGALLLLSTAMLVGTPGLPGSPEEAGASMIATRLGQIREVPLEDGSRVTLDTATSLRVELGPEMRQVTLERGRARFAVSGGDTRPFVVAAGPARVTSQDSLFDVGVARGGAEVRTYRGAIEITPAAGPADAPTVRLLAGQAVVVPTGAAPVERRQGDLSPPLWTTGVLQFDETMLANVVAEANRYSRVQILLADPELATLRVTGTFRAGDVAGLARSLAAAFDLELRSEGGGRLVLAAGGVERKDTG